MPVLSRQLYELSGHASKPGVWSNNLILTFTQVYWKHSLIQIYRMLLELA